jgi:hypothetical protein
MLLKSKKYFFLLATICMVNGVIASDTASAEAQAPVAPVEMPVQETAEEAALVEQAAAEEAAIAEAEHEEKGAVEASSSK